MPHIPAAVNTNLANRTITSEGTERAYDQSEHWNYYADQCFFRAPWRSAVADRFGTMAWYVFRISSSTSAGGGLRRLICSFTAAPGASTSTNAAHCNSVDVVRPNAW